MEAVLLIARFTKIRRQIKRNHEENAYKEHLAFIGILGYVNS
ncbi:hypothetical protein [Lutispora saccharofermentans]